MFPNIRDLSPRTKHILEESCDDYTGDDGREEEHHTEELIPCNLLIEEERHQEAGWHQNKETDRPVNQGIAQRLCNKVIRLCKGRKNQLKVVKIIRHRIIKEVMFEGDRDRFNGPIHPENTQVDERND